MRIHATVRAAVVVLAAAALLSGCSWTGLNSVPLPFTKGGGGDRIEITVELENAANLVPNSEVKYGEVTVGSVRRIELEDWVATLTVGLEGDVRVPADATASVAQKSLLGAEYLELKSTGSEQSERPTYLASGDVIGRDRTQRYPETEEVLSAASLLLNGGGLPQIQTIAHELNAALGGRAPDIRSFVRTVTRFTGRLDRQRDNIAATLTQLNRLSRTVVGDREKVSRLLDGLPAGLTVIASERKRLVRTLRSLDDFGTVAHRVISGTKRDLQSNLQNLTRITKQLADHSDNLADSFDGLTYPFSVRGADNVIFGDYINLVTEIEVSPGNLTEHWLGGTPLDGLFPAIIDGAPAGPAVDAGDPLAGDPLRGLLDDVEGLLGGDSSARKDRRSGQGVKKSPPPSEPAAGTTDLLSGLLGPIREGR